MMRFYLLLLLFSISCFSVEDYFGKEFIFAIPHNDDPNFNEANKTNNVIELNISAKENANVVISRNGRVLKSYFIRENQSESIRSSDFFDNEVFETGEGNYQSEKVYKITSDGLISANLVNYFLYSSEAMTMLPVESWGKNYSHISYWNSRQSANANRKTGFIILASEDDTEIEIELNGRSRGFYSINRNYRISDKINITLDKNMIYNVEASGQDNSIDITGSVIKANKKIAVISHHQRTGIYSNFNVGRDNLLEMFPPMKAWGKNFVTTAFDRKNKGDYFRVLAGEERSQISYTSYDKDTKDIIDEGVINLAPHEFFEVTSNEEGIRGITHWKSDNPVLISQSSFSAEFDGVDDYDPTLVYIVPVEQYHKEIIFKSPLGDVFEVNKLNLIIDNSSGQIQDLQNIRYNGIPILTLDPDLPNKQLPGTNYHYTTLDVNVNVSNVIDGDLEFYAVSYGNKEYDSYAITIGGSFRNLQIEDVIAPEITFSQDCKNFNIQAAERAISELGLDENDYYQSGLASFNLLALENFSQLEKNDSEINLKVIDLERNAFAILSAIDSIGNEKIDTINYTPAISKLNLDFEYINKTYKPGEDFKLVIKLNNYYDLIDIDSLFLNFKHPTRAMYLYNKDNISFTESNDTTYYKLNVTDLVNGNTQEIELVFETLLWDERSFALSFEEEIKDNCLQILTDDINLEYDDCIYDFRQVESSKFDYSLNVKVIDRSLEVTVFSPFDQKAQVRIIDLTGSTKYSEIKTLNEGKNKLNLNSLNLSSGVYFIRVDTETTRLIGKFVYE